MLKDYKEITFDENAPCGIEYNLHTHNYLCGHASGEVVDYVSEAVKNNLKLIGISDHIRQPHVETSYVYIDDLDEKYLRQFIPAKELYGDRTEILAGGEIEYLSENNNYYKKLLKKLNYLILGQHFFKYNGEIVSVFTPGKTENMVLSYFAQLKAGVKTGYFSVLAHPDMILLSGIIVTPKLECALKDLIATAKNAGVFTELNANGIRGNGFFYPSDLLVNICLELNAPVVVSSDAHSPSALCDEHFKKLCFYAKNKGLRIASLKEIQAKIKGL